MLRNLCLALAGLALLTVGCRTTSNRPSYYQAPAVISASPAPCCNVPGPPPPIPGAPVPVR